MGNGSSKKAKRPGMPKKAPKALRDFVACTRPSVEVDTSRLDWVPLGGALEFVSVGVKPGTAPNTGTVTIGMIEIPASVSSSGELVLDTSSQGLRLPIGKGRTLKDAVDNWVSEFNGWMAHNGKRLDGFSMKGTKVTLTKKPVGADDSDTETEVGGGPGITAPPAAEPTAEPAVAVGAPATEETPWYGTTLAKVVGTVTVIGGALGIYFGVIAGNGDDTSTEVTGGQDTEQVEQAQDPPPAPEPSPEPDPPPAAESDAEPEPEPETESEPIGLAPFDPFTGDHSQIDFPDVGQAWNVENEENFGEIAIPGDPDAEIVIRSDATGGAHVIGFTDSIASGGLELFSFGLDGQNGFTVLFPTDPNQGFGVDDGDFLLGDCATGASIFRGSIAQLGDSTGASLYLDTDDPAFPPGTTATAGFFFEDLTPTEFAFDPATGTVTTDGSAISDDFLDCMNEPGNASLVQDFVGAPTPPGQSSDPDIAALQQVFGPPGEIFADGFESGDVSAWYFTAAPAGNTIDCATGEFDSSGPGADIIGVGGFLDGTTLNARVFTAQPPSMSFDNSESFAISLEAVTLDNQVRGFVFERHLGEDRIGELNEDGSVSAADIIVGDTFVDFSFDVGSNPPALLFAAGANIAAPGGTRVCDSALAPGDPFLGRTPTGRFEISVPDGFEQEPSISDGTLFAGDSGNALFRVLNACELSDTYWVFASVATDVPFTLTVTDTETGTTHEYSNPLGQPAAAITDTSAFATCP